MDENRHNERPQRGRVLRAADVIPPFDKIVPPSGKGETDKQIAARAPTKATAPRLAAAEIPEYDLAEHILAEQRRAAAKRRRAPSQSEPEPSAPVKNATVKATVPEPGSQDLLELQRIVAEIVARDIERLCKPGPSLARS